MCIHQRHKVLDHMDQQSHLSLQIILYHLKHNFIVYEKESFRLLYIRYALLRVFIFQYMSGNKIKNKTTAK